MFELTVVIIFNAMLRVLFWTGGATDDMTHLWFTKIRSCNADLLDNDPGNSVIPGHIGYPTLAHAVISLFPRRHWKLAGKVLNICYDCLLIAAIWFLVRTVVPAMDSLPISVASLAALAAGTSPILLPITARMKSLGARTLGSLITLSYFLCIWGGMNGYPLQCGAAALLLGLLTVMTSKFAFQVIVLSAPFLGFFMWSWYPLLPIAGLLLVLLVIPVRGIRDNVRHMIEHTKWYCRNAQKGTTVVGRNRLRDLLNLPHYWKTNKDVFWGVLFRRNSYIIALYSFPLLWFPLLYLWTASGAASGGSLIHFSAMTTVSLACVVLLISQRPLAFLGQAERYFEYAVPFAAFVFAFQLSSGAVSGQTAYLIILVQLSLCFANVAYVNFADIKDALTDAAEDPAVRFLDSLSGRNILTIPMKLSCNLSYLANSDNKFYFKLVLHEEHGMDHRDEEMPWLEMPCDDLGLFQRRYGVDTLFVDKHFLDRKQQEFGIKYDLSDWEDIYEDSRYAVYVSPS